MLSTRKQAHFSSKRLLWLCLVMQRDCFLRRRCGETQPELTDRVAAIKQSSLYLLAENTA